MTSSDNNYLRFVAFSVIGLVFLTVVHLECFASEQPVSKQHSFIDAISIIQKGQLLKKEYLYELTQSELQIARNAVYARHGSPFNRYEIVSYFQRRSWYQTDKRFTEERLTVNDRKNVGRIKEAERVSYSRPDNCTVEGAMRLYLDAFFRADSNAFLALCNPKYPPRFTGYEIGTIKRLGSSILNRKELEKDFATRGVNWTDYFGDAGGAAQYRWTILGTTLDDWKQDGVIFRLPPENDPNPKASNAIYVRWQKIDGRYYIAEFSDILV